MSESTIEIMNRGMSCLEEKLGIVEAEQFISVIIREKFDYTKWQESHFGNMTPAQIDKEADEYLKNHPFKGNAKIVL